jgi:hypothetical protein
MLNGVWAVVKSPARTSNRKDSKNQLQYGVGSAQGEIIWHPCELHSVFQSGERCNHADYSPYISNQLSTLWCSGLERGSDLLTLSYISFFRLWLQR